MEIKWETMDYIAFILLGMLTIFCGNKQLQQLVAGLYIALAIWYVYTIIYEVKRYRQQKKDINSFTECLENVKKVQRIPDDIEMQKIGSGLVTFPSNFDGTFYAIKIRAGEFIAVHEKLYCMLTESSNIILLQAKSPIAAYELAVGESMIIDNRKLAAASSSLICEGKFLQTLYQMLGIRKRYEEKIIGPGRLWLTDTPIKKKNPKSTSSTKNIERKNMDTIEKDITEILYNLRRIRRKKHLSQKDVAEKMGTTQQVVSKIENGNPSIRTFYAYCRAIGVI